MKVIFLIIAVPLFIGCKENKTCNPRNEITVPTSNGTELVKVIDECNKNRVISEQQVLKLPDSTTIPHGYYKDYHLNGNIRTFGFFNKGLQDSTGIRYFDNGKPEAINYFSQAGQLIGPQYSFYDNGIMRSVKFCKNDTNVWFAIEFDKHGNEIKTEGYPLKLLARSGYETLKVGEDFAVVNQVALFNGRIAVLHLQLSNPNDMILDTAIKTFIHANNTDFYPLVKKLKKKGSFTYQVQLQLIDTNGRYEPIQYNMTKSISVK
jgi:hypothetical protein